MLKPVKSTENISRFVFSSKHIRKSDNTVKYAAFLSRVDGDTSVFRTSGLSGEMIFEIVQNVFQDGEIERYKGRADLKASVIFNKGLSVIPEEPPPKHANITNWPIDESKRKEIALELAAEAQLYLR